MADALRTLGQTRLFAGDDVGADAASVEALAAYRNLGDRRGEAWALQSLAWTAFLRGDFGPAEDRLHASADAFSEIGDWGGHSWAMGLLGWVRFSQGHLDEAEQIGRSLLAEAHTGDQWATGMMTVLLANISLWKGRTSEAVTLASAARSVFLELADSWAETQALAPLARALLAVGAIDEGRALLEELLSTSRQVADARMRRIGRGAVAIALTQQLGEGASVLDMADEFLGGAAQDVIPEQRSVIGLALLQAGRVDEGLAQLEQALEAAESAALAAPAPPQPNCGSMLALGYLAVGRPGAARAALARHTGPELGTYADRGGRPSPVATPRCSMATSSA